MFPNVGNDVDVKNYILTMFPNVDNASHIQMESLRLIKKINATLIVVPFQYFVVSTFSIECSPVSIGLCSLHWLKCDQGQQPNNLVLPNKFQVLL